MKRRADGTLFIPKQPPPRQGIRYLHSVRQSMNVPYIVDIDDADAFLWTIHIPLDVITTFDEKLGRQLTLWATAAGKEPAVSLSIRFPSTYPNSVPFVRVIRPRFVFHTGHVTVGGSICTPLLTASGWKAMDPEALVRSVMVIWKEGNARIQTAPDMYCGVPFKDYSEQEAKDAFDRVAREHGWQ